MGPINQLPTQPVERAIPPPTVALYTSVSEFKLQFLIDTGSNYSFIKLSSIINKVEINRFDTKKLTGIGKDSISTVGSIMIDIRIDNIGIKFPFQVIDDIDTKLTYAGILGRDFQKFTRMIINWDEKHISMKVLEQLFHFSLNVNQDEITVGKCSQSVHLINTEFDGLRVITRQEIAPGVFLPNAVIESINNKAFVPILNMNHEDVRIENFILSGESTENFMIETERVVKMNEKLDLGHLNAKTKGKLTDLLGKFNDCFYLKGDKLSTTHLIEHEIPLTKNEPIFVRQPPVPLKQREALRQTLKEYLENDIIRESTSLYNAPIYLIKKKQTGNEPQELRPIIDYRKLNSFTAKQYYTLPNIEELLGRLGKSMIFTSLDLTKAFHQIPLAEKDQEKTAFSTPFGRYCFKRAPFGLSYCPFTMSRLLDKIISNVSEIPSGILGFIDDLLIASETEEEHFEKLEQVLDKLRKANLKVSLSKSQWMKPELRFLGFDLTQDGIQIPREYVESITHLSVPRTEKQLRGFIGKCNYVSKFIPNFQMKIHPLNMLLCKNKEIIFGEKEIEAFENMKTDILNATKLSFPDESSRFEIHVDASKEGIGCLFKNQNKDEPPIFYLSRVTTNSEKNYSATELELLAISYFVKKLSFWLLVNHFKVYSDHLPLRTIFASNNIENRRLLRMKLQLADYDFSVVYVKGKSNLSPDYLSRNPNPNVLIDKESDTEDAYIDFPVTYPSIKGHSPPGQEHEINVEVTTTQQHFNRMNSPFTESQKSPLTKSDQVLVVTRAQRRKQPPSEQVALEKLFFDLKAREHFQSRIEPRMNLVTPEYNDIIRVNDLPTKIPRFEIDFVNDLANMKQVVKTRNNVEVNFYEIPEIDPEFENYFWFSVIRTMNEYIEKHKLKRLVLKMVNKDDKFVQILRKLWALTKKPDCKILIYVDDKIEITDNTTLNKIIKQCHEAPPSGHRGVQKTFQLINCDYKARKLFQKVKNYVSKCMICQQVKTSRTTKQNLTITKTPEYPFHTIAYDFFGPMEPTNSNPKYTSILTIVCMFTRFLILVPTPDQTAETVARALLDHVILPYGTIPEVIQSDCAQNFKSKVMAHIFKLLKIKKNHTVPYSPWQNGNVEKKNLQIKYYLQSAYIETGRKDNWHEHTKYISYAYNTSMNTSTGFSPFELMYGTRHRNLCNLGVRECPYSKTYGDYVEELRSKLRYLQTTARENIRKAQLKAKEYYDRRANEVHLEPGDLVLLRDPNAMTDKFEPRFTGPFRVISCSKTAAKIQKGKKISLVNTNFLKKCILD